MAELLTDLQYDTFTKQICLNQLEYNNNNNSMSAHKYSQHGE